MRITTGGTMRTVRSPRPTHCLEPEHETEAGERVGGERPDDEAEKYRDSR